MMSTGQGYGHRCSEREHCHQKDLPAHPGRGQHGVLQDKLFIANMRALALMRRQHSLLCRCDVDGYVIADIPDE